MAAPRRAHLWLSLCLLASSASSACVDKPSFHLPGDSDHGVTIDGSRDGDAGQTPTVECDQAEEGTPCGKAGRGFHCIYDVCSANVCGDGVRADEEACDDGNERDGDGCDDHCRKEPPPSCGDGQVDPGEACDDGNADDTDLCTTMCVYAICGDGLVGPGEECDDGNQINSDACLSTCREATCGDGYVGPGELCDDADDDDADGCTHTCQLSGDAGAVADSGTELEVDAGSDSGSMVEVDAGATPEVDAGGTTDTDAGSVVDETACLDCEVLNCTDYLGAGVDLIAGCYHDPDPSKIQLCVDAIACARVHDCAYTPRGAEVCYCGTASSANCQLGTGVNGKCRAEFEAAAGSTSAQVVTGHFGDRSLPIGNAVFMLQCDRDFCASTTPGSLCTP